MLEKLGKKLAHLAASVLAWFQNEALTLLNTGPAGKGTGIDIPLSNPDGSALHLIIDITTANLGGGAGSITVSVQGIDPASGKKYLLLASVALVAIGTTVLRVGTALTAAANTISNDSIPKNFNVNVVANNANPMVYTIGANIIK